LESRIHVPERTSGQYCEPFHCSSTHRQGHGWIRRAPGTGARSRDHSRSETSAPLPAGTQVGQLRVVRRVAARTVAARRTPFPPCRASDLIRRDAQQVKRSNDYAPSRPNVLSSMARQEQHRAGVRWKEAIESRSKMRATLSRVSQQTDTGSCIHTAVLIDANSCSLRPPPRCCANVSASQIRCRPIPRPQEPPRRIHAQKVLQCPMLYKMSS